MQKKVVATVSWTTSFFFDYLLYLLFVGGVAYAQLAAYLVDDLECGD